MTIQEFVARQDGFIGKTVVFTIEWNDGDLTQVERAINIPGEYHVPTSHSFKITEVSIKEN